MRLYRKIEHGIRQQWKMLHVDNIVQKSEIRHAVRLVMRNNPDIFWFAHQYDYDEANSTIHFQYSFSEERVNSIQQSITDVIDNDFCIEYVKTLTRQQQIVYVYKWLVSYCNYNVNSAYNQSIYSVFVRRNSVCTGYAKAAQYLLNLLGIESRLVFGRLNNDKEDGRHCWNLIKIDNEYYHFDACLGDCILDNVVLQSGVQELFKVDGINYNFLCASTDEMLKTRSIEDIETLPECPISWSRNLIISLAGTEIKKREEIKGCLLSHIGSSADIYLCSKDKNTILKVFRPNSKTTSQEEFHYMQQIKGCHHLLQCNENYTDIIQNIVAIEQSTPIVDLLCSHYYELSLKGVIKMATDVALAWKECQERGVLYRDIHVCNIYRSNDGTFKLGDFGSCTNGFNIKETVGNQWFMAPETFVSGVFTEASAIYSISMVMYFILNNLRPAFWKSGCEDEALRTRMNGRELPTPIGCINIPSHLKTKLDNFFRSTSASSSKERIGSIEEFIYELKNLTYYCESQDYVIYRKGISLELDLNVGKRLDVRRDHISRELYHRYAMGDEVEQVCTTGFEAMHGESLVMGDEVERMCTTRGMGVSSSIGDVGISSSAPKKGISETPVFTSISYSPSMIAEVGNELPRPRPLPKPMVPECSQSLLKRIIGAFSKNTNNKKERKNREREDLEYFKVYSSVFAPAEVRPKSHLQVKVYLHLLEETEMVKSLAQETDKNAERRDYIPLSLKLKMGDKVDVEFNIYGETCLMSERKSIIWQGSFTKCSFDYFVPKDIDVDELSCKALLTVNGIPVGEMLFITRIMEIPTPIDPKIIVRKYNKIFISYAHQDEEKVKFLAEGFKMLEADYFFDRHHLKVGDIFPEKIQDYINHADLFILCWSDNAAKSEYVEKERSQAMERAFPKIKPADKAELSIYPMNIEPKAELPDDMKNYYHFGVM